ncbi:MULTISPECIES: ParB/RepB/Spo0J family partition protein [unclassified Bradyrhizobium]|uniref:ParB/RepB/Spo0J family partition protein n=1 Tax=unclassified Bradyrhizobium TaxID=2631580 RepID=UPI001CD3FF42|nr:MULTISPECIES: ParB/RepB/Spo0J family partition protein [unclassified Bradyrhizobium]MCA1437210.1 ParB N-terminal domain-containing protein [Bradyrhizobium sp. BRP20]MCA1472516.1 ParB N-terminal domain-containing protein [Bradyrhizobium sp. IC3195]MCA1502028.1 ParB N-terminal domain-containing protein [Bradyrhizobium sp. NBAIM14]MCA1551295.1 ParB N-terminal domain-containing protein [Bradyrhizobium sp. BRP19]
MANVVQKITLSSSRDIPFNKLVLSQSNVRRVKAGISIEELAEDIARRTLLQSLNVRPVLNPEGTETGMFEIPAGGRRYRALELLVKQKRLAKTAPVPCVVRDPATTILAEDDSLAENIQRAPLHPLDQFRAFLALREKGQSEEDIAAAFFTSVNVVKQRLRLASVSPALLDAYAEDGMSLEQLMAFTVSADHGRQEQVWQAISGAWQKEPYQIRRMLTEKTVRAFDRRAMFVGLDAYEAAGGVVLRDLFQSDDGGWLEDVALLDRLVAEKLQAEAQTIAAEGWKWIQLAIDFPYGHTRGLRELDGVPADLTAEEQAAIEALKAEYAKLEAEHDGADELPDEVDQRLGEIETALAVLNDRPVIYQPADIARAGVFVGIDAEGKLLVDRGYVRPEDEVPVSEPEQGRGSEPDAAALDGDEPSAPVVQRAVITIGGQVADPEDEDDDAVKPLPDRLLTELTAERTLALRDKLAITPSVAFQAVLHKFCLDVFSRYSSFGTAMEVSVRSVSFPVQAQGLKDTPAAKAIDARHKTWEERLPKDKAGLWDWLTRLTGDEQAALFAHCASFGVNALYEKGDRYGGGATPHAVEQRIADADRIALAVDLDMVASGWRPTVENYLGRVPKRRILEAVREGAGERAAQLIDHLKKGDMAKEAERLLAETGWLPEPLRMADADQAAPGDAAESEGDDEALPEFLAGDDEETPADQADESRMLAAE